LRPGRHHLAPEKGAVQQAGVQHVHDPGEIRSSLLPPRKAVVQKQVVLDLDPERAQIVQLEA
jgi:hypothetical protein